MISRGLGEYPGYYCYDANRPSWLPNWIDDFTESACKDSPATIAGNLWSCTIGSLLGDKSCQTPPANWNPDPTVSGPGVDPASLAKTQCPLLQSWDPIQAQCTWNLTSPLALVTIGLGAFLLIDVLRR